jgi:hypothetical protein
MTPHIPHLHYIYRTTLHHVHMKKSLFRAHACWLITCKRITTWLHFDALSAYQRGLAWLRKVSHRSTRLLKCPTDQLDSSAAQFVSMYLPTTPSDYYNVFFFLKCFLCWTCISAAAAYEPRWLLSSLKRTIKRHAECGK